MSKFLKILEDYRSILEQEGEEFPADSSELPQEPSPQTQISNETDSGLDVVSKTDLVNFLNAFSDFLSKVDPQDSNSFKDTLTDITIDNALEKFRNITGKINPSSIESNSPTLTQSTDAVSMS